MVAAQAEQMEHEIFSFQAEAVQILDLMIHSLYSNKEIFLRELISNSSDAIDRLRLELLSRAEIPEVDGPLRIRVGYDKDAGTITIADNGVGMSWDEVIANIGTIAKSGTREFLRFIRGVIDSSDLRLAELAENEPDKYATFWKEFGITLKEGIADDYSNRDEIANLLLFTSTKSATDDPDTSLAGYVARMKEGQENIYYLLAPSLAAAKSSPHLEAFRAKGVEVLLLGQGVDNWVVSSLREFDGKKLQSVAQGTADLGVLADEEEKQAKELAYAEYADLLGKLKAYLAGQAWDVRLSTRLTTSPACIISNEPEIDINLMHRLRGTGLPRQAVLELNPKHPLIQRLNRSQDDKHVGEWAQVLFN